MNFIRPILILVVIALPIWVSGKYVPHHSAGDIFSTLYMHLVPARLEVPSDDGHGEHAGEDEGDPATDPHADPHAAAAGHADEPSDEHGEPHYLLAFTLPGVPALFDMDKAHEGSQLVATNLQLFQIAAVLLCLVCFSGVPSYLRTGRGDYTSRLFAGFALWVRDEMVYPTMGKQLGQKFLPYFLTLFFFLFFMNLMGLVPGSATATASIFVTGAMAVTTLLTMLVGGMVAQGPIAFWKNLVPHVPLPLWPILFVVELAGLIVKPVALMIRLFANMTGGHMVVLSFLGLIFVLAEMSKTIGWVTSPVVVGFAIFVMIIEAFVAMLQAYIFTMLSIIFIQASIHPEH